MTLRSQLGSWQALQHSAVHARDFSLPALFAADPQRFERYSLQAAGLLLDYSKNLIDETVLRQLLQLAADCDVAAWRDRQFSGEHINITEDRPVLHTRLRAANPDDDVAEVLAAIRVFAGAMRAGELRGFSGQPLRQVLCLGVGGSHLGPEMVTRVLASGGPVTLQFVSTVDGEELARALAALDPAQTLVVISSKTFTTAETLANAEAARQWLSAAAAGNDIGPQLAAVTMAVDSALAFGVPARQCFRIWDWVGGRFSLWSAVGLPIALALGFDTFSELLSGAAQMDAHFTTAPLSQNMPVLLALIGVWNATFLGFRTQAVLPYPQALSRLPAYLQQAEMESNGKSVNWDGEPIDYPTCPVIWGEPGNNGQHAFFQLLHQGTQVVPADFIAAVRGRAEFAEHQHQLLANCLAQSQALMNGVSAPQVQADLAARGLSAERIAVLLPHKLHPGNRPSNTLLMQQLDARSLGALVALYEHKIFVQGILWQVCSFDQWGVELGKQLATALAPRLRDGETAQLDASTAGLLARIRDWQ